MIPELKESEYEKTRRDLINFVKLYGDNYYGQVSKAYAISWLEKQVEKTNPYSGTSFEYNGHTWGICARDNGVDISLDGQLFKHLDEQGEKLPAGFYYVNSKGEKFYSDTLKYGDVILHIENQDEQKTWSEEDENRFNNLIHLVENSNEGEATRMDLLLL